MKQFALAACACVGLAAPVDVSAAGAAGGPTTVLHFLDITAGFKATIPFNQEPKFGDSFMFRDEVYRWNKGKRGAHVGHADVIGRVLTADLMRFEATATLPGGTIEVSGVGGNGRITHLAVVGGTGAYATARGEVIVRNLGGENSNHSAITIRLWS